MKIEFPCTVHPSSWFKGINFDLVCIYYITLSKLTRHIIPFALNIYQKLCNIGFGNKGSVFGDWYYALQFCTGVERNANPYFQTNSHDFLSFFFSFYSCFTLRWIDFRCLLKKRFLFSNILINSYVRKWGKKKDVLCFFWFSKSQCEDVDLGLWT